MASRDEDLIARHLLEHQEEIDVCFKNREWAKLAALVRYARRDAPKSLIHTDPALYRHLRECNTRFHLRGGGAFSLEKLEALARGA
jgi:hypothetical protein